MKRRWGSHTTLDSNGFNEPERIHDLLDHTDLVLLDLKHIDDEEHIKSDRQIQRENVENSQVVIGARSENVDTPRVCAWYS